MLKGHTYEERKTANWLKCLQKCEDDVRCQSFNYVITRGICELNNRTKEARPQDFDTDSDRFYIKRFIERGITVFRSVVVLNNRIALLCHCPLHKCVLSLNTNRLAHSAGAHTGLLNMK